MCALCIVQSVSMYHIVYRTEFVHIEQRVGVSKRYKCRPAADGCGSE